MKVKICVLYCITCFAVYLHCRIANSSELAYVLPHILIFVMKTLYINSQHFFKNALKILEGSYLRIMHRHPSKNTLQVTYFWLSGIKLLSYKLILFL